MSDEKKGKVFLISMTVIIVLLFLSQGAYPKYKAGKYEEEQKKIAAEQKKSRCQSGRLYRRICVTVTG